MKKWIPTIIFIMTIVLVLGGCSVEKNTSNEKFSSFSSSGKEPESSSDDVNVRTFESTGPRAWDAKFQVISSDKGNILVDPGKYDDELSNYVESIGGLDAILITHGHWDKLRGLDEAVAANANIKVYVHEKDYPYFKNTTLNASAEQGFDGATGTKAETLSEGNYEIGGYPITVIHTPGHTEGSVLYYFPEENILIGGDTIMADKVGSSQHPGGSESDRQSSIEEFKQLTFPEDMKIYSGHGETTTYVELLKTNSDLQE
ncbi:MBL fold metallo-hydrolase [Listeria monocytogenes]|nr:MBL fold metallo-hydrolase [Listeria monocytogenes]EAD4869081.1 MBL fold metallo-hydrolase [Listeria monocytogenes]EAE1331076.1 MBL fold metallo-hydrolase [Listeria monocytogenes]